MKYPYVYLLLTLTPGVADCAEPSGVHSDPPRLAASQRAFALNLHRHLAVSAPDRNLVVGAGSLHAALAMTEVGASGRTRAEFAAVLGLPSDLDDIAMCAEWTELHQALQPRMLQLRGREGRQASFLLDSARTVFGQRGVAWREGFRQRLDDGFDSPLELVDFRRTAAARKQINGWVEMHTAGRIDQLIAPDVLNSESRIVLVDASVFRASWPRALDPAATHAAPFHRASGDPVEVPTMHGVLAARTARRDAMQVIELPFQGGDTSLVVVMPDDPARLPEVEQELGPGRLAGLLAGAEKCGLELSLPRLDLRHSLDVAGALRGLGLRSAFTLGAEFERMAAIPLQVGQVLHECSLRLDESGVSAEAASAVVMQLTGGRPPRRTARVDRPFWFALRHVPTGVLLFTGRVVDPSR